MIRNAGDILIRHQNSYSFLLDVSPPGVLLPNNTQKQRPCRVHDSDVGHSPVTVVALQTLKDPKEEWVLRNRPHSIIRNSCWRGLPNPCSVGEERVKASIAPLRIAISNFVPKRLHQPNHMTYIVQVDINSSIMR